MRRRSSRGESTVEFAFASTVYFMALFGTVSGGLSMYRYNILANIAQEAARYGSVRGLSSPIRAQGTTANIQTVVQTSNPGVPITALTVTSGGATVDPMNLVAGSPIRVTVHSTWLPMTNYLPWGAFDISATSEMRMAR